MKISVDYRMLALDALRGKWKTAVLTGIAASALGATIVSSSNSVVSNSNQAKDIHFNLFAQPNGGRLLAVLLVGIGLFHCKCSTSWRRDIVSASYCTTRLRFEVKDYRQVNEQAVKAAGATGIIRPGKNACQVIVDTNVKSVYDELDKLLK